MKKPLIAVDLDGVLADFCTPFFIYFNSYFGTNFKHEDIFSYHFSEVTGKPDSTCYEMVKTFTTASAITNYYKIHPIFESYKVKQLKEKYDLVIITSRDEEFKLLTAAWVGDNFPDVFEKVYHTHEKVKLCLELGVELLIEDSYENCLDCSNNNIKTLLLNNPWNRKEVPEKCTRVYSWAHIIDLLSKPQFFSDNEFSE